jgi:hypothetical protein
MRVEILVFSFMNLIFLSTKRLLFQGWYSRWLKRYRSRMSVNKFLKRVLVNVSLLWGKPISQHFVRDFWVKKKFQFTTTLKLLSVFLSWRNCVIKWLYVTPVVLIAELIWSLILYRSSKWYTDLQGSCRYLSADKTRRCHEFFNTRPQWRIDVLHGIPWKEHWLAVATSLQLQGSLLPVWLPWSGMCLLL